MEFATYEYFMLHMSGHFVSSIQHNAKIFVCLQILSPTALALLSPDTADITMIRSAENEYEVCPKISIPRYSSLLIMKQKLQNFIANIISNTY
jgi:hypothetical protein